MTIDELKQTSEFQQLNCKQQTFVLMRLTGSDKLNATRAAYPDAVGANLRQNAHRLSRNPKVIAVLHLYDPQQYDRGTETDAESEVTAPSAEDYWPEVFTLERGPAEAEKIINSMRASKQPFPEPSAGIEEIRALTEKFDHEVGVLQPDGSRIKTSGEIVPAPKEPSSPAAKPLLSAHAIQPEEEPYDYEAHRERLEEAHRRATEAFQQRQWRDTLISGVASGRVIDLPAGDDPISRALRERELNELFQPGSEQKYEPKDWEG